MEDIIAPINKEVLKSELTEDKRLRFTNKSHNEIYIVTWKNAPNVLKEIGRLREIASRAAGVTIVCGPTTQTFFPSLLRASMSPAQIRRFMTSLLSIYLPALLRFIFQRFTL